MIKLDGEKRATTDRKGEFVIKVVPFGQYDFEADHQYFTFNPIQLNVDSRIIAKSPINPIQADLVSISGKVDFLQEGQDAKETENYSIKVTLKNKATNALRSTTTDKDGSYRFDSREGEYIVEPTITYNGKSFKVLPSTRVVKLESQPALGIDFSREKLSLRGKVDFVRGTQDSLLRKTKIVLRKSDGSIAEELTYANLKNGEFEFKDLFDEQNTVEIINNELCFDQTKVQSDNQTGQINFKQRGINMPTESTHNLPVVFSSDSASDQKTKISKGKSSICLEHTGSVNVVVTDNYTLKGVKNSFKVDTKSQRELNLKVEKVRFEARLSVDLEQMKKIYSSTLTDKQLISKFDMTFSSKNDGKSIKPVAEVRDGVVVFVGYVAAPSTILAKPTITDAELASRLVILQKEMKINVNSVYDAKAQTEPFEVTVGKKLTFTSDKNILDVEIKVSRREGTRGSFKPFKTINSDISSK